jgi:aspartate kinase
VSQKLNVLVLIYPSLLEVFGVLESIKTVKDTESVHYESLAREYERLIQVICEDHLRAAQSNIKDNELSEKLCVEIRSECKEILDYRVAAERWDLEIDRRSKDRIVSFGEKLSCRFMTALLKDKVRLVILTYNSDAE